MLRVLDTDICVAILRHRPAALQRLRRLSPDEVAVAAMTEAELRFGALKSREPGPGTASVEAFLLPLLRLPFDSDSAREHARLRLALQAAPIGERDLVIASVAVARGALLVSHNRKEFERVPGLGLEDWLD